MSPARRAGHVVLALLAASVVLAQPGPAAAREPCDRSPILVRGAMLWSEAGLQRRDVLFSDGRVARIADPGTIALPANARLIDGANHTLLPGLVDLHLHFTLRGLPGQGSEPRDPAPITGRQLLQSGVTSGRLHLSSLARAAAWKRQAADPCAPMPRLHAGGPRLDGATPEREEAIVWGVRSPADAVEKVGRIRAAGLDWIAIHEAHLFAPDVLQAIARAARANGLRIMGSAATFDELAAILSIDPDTIDYVDLSAAPDYPPELLAKIAASGATLAPTLGYAHRLHAFADTPARIGAAAHFGFMSAAEAAAVLMTARKEIAEIPYIAETLAAYPRLPRKFAQLRATGAPVAIATDVGSSAHFQADGIWWELAAWRAFGADAGATLRAATIAGAQALGDHAAGRLEVGSHADFLLYRGDVRNGTFDQKRLRVVAKAGALFVRDGRWVGD